MSDATAARACIGHEAFGRLDLRQAQRAYDGRMPFLDEHRALAELSAAVGVLGLSTTQVDRRSAALTVAAEALAIVEQIDEKERTR